MNTPMPTAAMAITKNPARSGNETITASSDPTTHAIWNWVSKRPNAAPWLAPGASRCTSESKASLAADAEPPTMRATSAAPLRPPAHTAATADTATATTAPTSIVSSLKRRRNHGAITFPAKPPKPQRAKGMAALYHGRPGSSRSSNPSAALTAAPAAVPIPDRSGSSDRTNSNSNKKKTKPTMPRKVAITNDASRTPDDRISRSSSVVSGSSTTTRGIFIENPTPTKYTMAAHHKVGVDPNNW